jgi:pyrimidine operon attenuation protein/uracil phosphoribosyltransferase
MEKSLILNGQQVEQKLLRMSQELIELHYGTQHEVIFIGIKEMGFEIAQTLFHFFKSNTDIACRLESIFFEKGKRKASFQFSGKTEHLKKKSIVIVDDVINSGLTLLHATHFILEAEPSRISVAALVNREHRIFPIFANVVGLTLSTNLKEHVSVVKKDNQFEAYLGNKAI